MNKPETIRNEIQNNLSSEVIQNTTQLIYKSFILMDSQNYEDYLMLCDDNFRYMITSYSPEIKKEMTWLEHDKNELKTLYKTLPNHNYDRSPLSRHVSVCTLENETEVDVIDVISTIIVFKTQLNTGETELLSTGKVYDKVVISNSPNLVFRNVKLDTRMLGLGSLVPI